MIELNDIVENIKAEYLRYEKERLAENAGEIDHRIYIRQIFKFCHDAIDEWASSRNPRFAERYRKILYLRYREDATLEYVALQLGLSRERVRQLELKLIKIIRDYFRKHCPEEFPEKTTSRPDAFSSAPVGNRKRRVSYTPSNRMNTDKTGAMP